MGGVFYLVDMLVDISNRLSKVVTWIINFAPFGIMGLVFDTVSNNGMSAVAYTHLCKICKSLHRGHIYSIAHILYLSVILM